MIESSSVTNNLRKNNEEMMSVASKMRQAMWLKAKQDLNKRRAMFFMNMRDNRRERPTMPMMLQGMQQRRPPMVPMFNMYNRQESNGGFMRFNRPTPPVPPMPHPVQQPPLSGRIVRIIKRKIIPLFPFIRRNSSPDSNGITRFRPPMVPRIVLSGRVTALPMRGMREFHPPAPSQPRIETPFQHFMNNQEFQQDNFPQNQDTQQPAGDYPTDGFHDHSDPHGNEGAGERFHVPLPHEGQLSPDNMMQVDLPNEPVQMPDLVVEQVPPSKSKPLDIIFLHRGFGHVDSAERCY